MEGTTEKNFVKLCNRPINSCTLYNPQQPFYDPRWSAILHIPLHESCRNFRIIAKCSIFNVYNDWPIAAENKRSKNPFSYSHKGAFKSYNIFELGLGSSSQPTKSSFKLLDLIDFAHIPKLINGVRCTALHRNPNEYFVIIYGYKT